MLARNTYDRSAGLSGYGQGAPLKQATRIPEEYEDLDIEEDEEEEIEEPTPQVLRGTYTHQCTVKRLMSASMHWYVTLWEGYQCG